MDANRPHTSRQGFMSLLAVAVILPAASCAHASPGGISSVYSNLTGPDCTLVSDDKETGATVHRCKGVAGWDLLVAYDDQRMSVTVVEPSGRKHPLEYWSVVTKGYSSLGPRAEWRLKGDGKEGQQPLALIVRVNASGQGNGGAKKTSYLAVARLQGGNICVVKSVPAAPDANERARQAADTVAQAACLAH